MMDDQKPILSTAPRNLEAEQSLLGIILYDPARMADVEGAVRAVEFYEPVHQVAFAAMEDLARNGAITLEAVSARVARNFAGHASSYVREAFDRLGGFDYLYNMVDRAPAAHMAAHYAGLVRDCATRRDIVSLAERLRAAAGSNEPVDEIVSRAEWSLREVSIGGRSDHWRDGTALGTVLRDKMAGRRKKSYISTGYPRLDRAIGGFRRARTTVVAGRPGMGKSAVGLEFCRKIAETNTAVRCTDGHYENRPTGAALFSLEMDDEELALRIACAATFDVDTRTGPEYFDIQRDQPKFDDKELMERGAEILDALPFYFDQRPRLTVGQVVPAAKRLIRQWEKDGIEPGLIMVDHLHLVKPDDDRYGNVAVEIGQVMGALDELAKETGVAVVILCQLNRETESRKNADKRPQLSDLKGSGNIEQDANTVIFIYRPEYYLTEPEDKSNDAEMMEFLDKKRRAEGVCELLVRKNRGGRNMMDHKMRISLAHNALWEDDNER